MKLFQIKQIAFFAFVAVAVSSCDKVKVPESMGTAGQTLVKIVGGGTTDDPGISKSPIDFVAKPTTLTAADVRRDIPNETELNKTMHITVKDDTAAVTLANTLNGTAYVHMPASWYTVGSTTPKTGGVGGTFSITMSPGEFAKPILITIPDATVLDPSTLYGLGFTITTADANGKISDTRTVVLEIGAKNAYDGIYSVEAGTVTRYTAPGVPANDVLSGSLVGNADVYMVTVGSAVVAIPAAGYVGGLYWAYGNNSMVAGIDGLRATVDPSTNLVTMTSSGNSTLTNWAGHTNSYDPSTKTFQLAFRWNPTSTTREYEVTLKYKTAR